MADGFQPIHVHGVARRRPDVADVADCEAGRQQRVRGHHGGVSADTKSPWKSDPVHIAVTRQGARVRVYLNQEKMWDVPRALLPTAKYNAIVFFVPNVDAGSEYFVSNVRLAVGAPDTRNKLLTQGKWVTNGILFDVNSDRIRAESYGTLKEVAGVLTENADLKVQIVGHTDSDGDAAANLDLSVAARPR